jgi:nucleotide-binding universal stress UspA family protein
VITVKKILLAIDGSDHSKRAIPAGAKLAKALDAEIIVEEIRGAGVASVQARTLALELGPHDITGHDVCRT